MKLRCLGSGSSGNCYLLTAGNGETLIIDPGVPIKEIKKALNWDISCVVGAVCTHHHAVCEIRQRLGTYGNTSAISHMNISGMLDFNKCK